MEEYITTIDVWAPGIVSGSQYLNQETNNLASTISPTPSANWLTAVDTLITTLKNASIWQTFDLFYGFAAPNASACSYNWVNTNVGQLTANGTLNYGANQYVASDGSTGYLSSSFTVNSGKAIDGSAEFGYFCLNECTTDDVSPFQTTGGKHYLGLQGDATGASIPNLIASLNTSAAITFSSQWGSTAGHWVLQQINSSTQLQLYIDGTSYTGTASQTNSADTGTVQLFKTTDGRFTTRKISFVHYGSQLSSSQQLTLSKALYTFLAAMDVRPKAGYLGLNGPLNVAPYKHCSTGNGNNLNMPTTPVLGSGEFQGRAGAYPYAAIKFNDPNYVNLFRLEVHPGDFSPLDASNSGVDRSQFNTQNSQSIPWQTTIDLSFSFFIEQGSVWDSSFNTLLDFHDTSTGVSCGPTHAIDPATGNFFVWGFFNKTTNINNSPITSSIAVAQGTWHHVRTTFRLDNSPNGFCQSWLDGVQILNYSGGFGNPTGAPFWQQMSLARGNNNQAAAAIWYANIELDTSGSQPFSSRILNPLAVPQLTQSATPPTNQIAPVITNSITSQGGTYAVQGQPLTVSTGTWSGSPELTFSYQWRNNGVAISGATSNTYTPQETDDSCTIDCVVTASVGALPPTTRSVSQASSNSLTGIAGTLVLDEPFASQDSWSSATSISFSGGNLVATSVAAGIKSSKTVTLTDGSTYELIYGWNTSNGSTIEMFVSDSAMDNDVNGTQRSASGTYVDTIVAPTNSAVVGIQCVSANCSGTLDNLLVVQKPAGLISGFTSANSGHFTIAGQTVENNNANQTWSINKTGPSTLEFSVHQGDNWTTSGWSDAVNDAGANRSEVEFQTKYSAGQVITVTETLTIQPGTQNSAHFFDINQLHADTESPPSPFTFQLQDSTDYMVVVLQDPNNSFNQVWQSPAPVARGTPMALKFQMKMDPTGGTGFVKVWMNGTQIVNYTGNVGATGAQYYWKMGIYRGSATETVTLDISDFTISAV